MAHSASPSPDALGEAPPPSFSTCDGSNPHDRLIPQEQPGHCYPPFSFQLTPPPEDCVSPAPPTGALTPPKDSTSSSFGGNLTTSADHEYLRLSEYQFVKVLGEGATARVYLSTRRSDKRVLAIKTISKKFCANSSAYAPLKNEARVLAACNHPFIVKIEAAFQNREYLFMALEFVSGGDFFDLMHKYAPMTGSHVKFFVSQVVLALDYLHSNQIVHGDLKPENLLVTANGYLKLTDFGFAGTLTVPPVDYAVGTLEYFAPETIKRTHYGPSIDWWALGVTMYECLYGDIPFCAGSPNTPGYAEKTKSLILSANFDIPRATGEACLAFLRKLLSSDHQDRQLSWKTISDDFIYFEPFMWKHILNMTCEAPYIPDCIPVPAATANGRDYSTQLQDKEVGPNPKYHGKFDNFHYLRST